MIWTVILILLTSSALAKSVKKQGNLTRINDNPLDQVETGIAVDSAEARELNSSKLILPEKLKQYLKGSVNASRSDISKKLRDYLVQINFPALVNVSDDDLMAMVDRYRRQQNETDVDSADVFSNLTNETSTANVTNTDNVSVSSASPVSIQAEADASVTGLSESFDPTAQIQSETMTSATIEVTSINEDGGDNSANANATEIALNSTDLHKQDEFSTSDYGDSPTLDNCQRANAIVQALVGKWSRMDSHSYKAQVEDVGETDDVSTPISPSDSEINLDNTIYIPFNKPEISTWQILNDIRSNPTLWSIFERDPESLFIASHWVRRTYFPNVPEPMIDPVSVNKMILERQLSRPSMTNEQSDLKILLAEIEKQPAIRDMFINAPDVLPYLVDSLQTKYPELNISIESTNCTVNRSDTQEIRDPTPWYMKVRLLLKKEFQNQPRMLAAYYDRISQCVTKCSVAYEFDENEGALKGLNAPWASELSNSLKPDLTDEQLKFVERVMSNPIILKIIIDEWQFVSIVLEEGIKAEILHNVHRRSPLHSAILNFFTRYPYTLEKLLQNPYLVPYALQNNPVATKHGTGNMPCRYYKLEPAGIINSPIALVKHSDSE